MREKLSNPQALRLSPKMLEDCHKIAEKYGVSVSEIFRMLLGKALYGEPQKTVKLRRRKNEPLGK